MDNRSRNGVAEKNAVLSGKDEISSWPERLKLLVLSKVPSSEVTITLTKNRRTMVSVRREPGLCRVRVHEVFLQADETVMLALAKFIVSNQREAASEVQAFIDAAHAQGGAAVPHRNKHRGQAEGHVHQLQEIYSELNQRYFESKIQAQIMWGKRVNPRKRQRSIRLGSYSLEDRTIRIHPSLDRIFVPRYFVAWVVYHEMLHQRHDIPIVKGRRRFHTKEFLDEERMFDEYERAKQWERTHLHRLLLY